jgi:hypothetical protein
MVKKMIYKRYIFINKIQHSKNKMDHLINKYEYKIDRICCDSNIELFNHILKYKQLKINCKYIVRQTRIC